ncbi:MAG TPA: hypothetical protein VGQ76_04800 [Thermoanaerobaculia bacterium]|jgi:hypothetical protein|nr:hypothetical protein [Thermoanaerobaculia bacterium]
MPEPRQDFNHERPEPSVALSHLVHTLRKYTPAIILGLAAVSVGYIILATALYLFAPSQRVTTQSFRLDFKGAERGEYPNGMKFATTEIVSAPILLKVFNQNDLVRFVQFPDFARSLVVLESNLAVEALTRDFQARLLDPKLMPLDRERIQREYESRLAAINKGQYAIHYMRKSRGADVPDVLVRKVLTEVLTEWANFVANEQHVLEYRIAVISPEVLSASSVEGTNPVINIDMLRAKVLRVLANLEQIRELPAAELARTKKDSLSLTDISTRLDEIVRFRLEPLIHRAAAAGLDDRNETLHYLESQLSYDQRTLDGQQRMTETMHRTLSLYLNRQSASELPSAPARGRQPEATVDTVMPQLNDSFLDRLINLTSSAGDQLYRQAIADKYRDAALEIIPLQEALAYHQSILDYVRSNPSGDGLSRELVDQQILNTRNETRSLVLKMHEIHKNASLNLSPSTELISRSGVPITRVIRAISIKQLAMYGILTVFLALPVLIFAALVHNRVREEDAAEEVTRSEAATQA